LAALSIELDGLEGESAPAGSGRGSAAAFPGPCHCESSEGAAFYRFKRSCWLTMSVFVQRRRETPCWRKISPPGSDVAQGRADDPPLLAREGLIKILAEPMAPTGRTRRRLQDGSLGEGEMNFEAAAQEKWRRGRRWSSRRSANANWHAVGGGEVAAAEDSLFPLCSKTS